MSNRLFRYAAALSGLSALIVGCGESQPGDAGADPATTKAEIVAVDLNGLEAKLDGLRGKAVLLNFWALT